MAPFKLIASPAHGEYLRLRSLLQLGYAMTTVSGAFRSLQVGA